MKRTPEEITNAIIAYFKENEEIFNACIEELDSYNSYLGDDRYYEMEMLNDFYNGIEPLELLYRVFYGYDEDDYTTDSTGNITHLEFNPNREYFRYNAYGNLMSANYKDYSAHLDSYFIESLSENRQYIDIIEENEELTAVFDELEQDENREE